MMKITDIDSEIFKTLFKKIEDSERKNPSFDISDKVKDILKNIISSKTIDNRNIEYINFFKGKFEVLLRKEEVQMNWRDMPYLKLDEKEYILEDINNIGDFSEFYYSIIKKISDMIQLYRRKGVKNNLLEKNILFLKKIKTRLEEIKKDDLDKKYLNEYENIFKNINFEIDKAELKRGEFLYKHWRTVGNVNLEEKVFIIEKIDTKEELIEFYKKFKKTFSVLENKYKIKSNQEKIKLKNYLNSIKNKCDELNNYGNLNYSSKLKIIKNKMIFFLDKIIIEEPK